MAAAKARFWAGGSSSESESENESSSEEEVMAQKPTGGKFGMVYESDSESDDEVRVVRSQKDRAWDSMRDSIKRMRSAMKINDWSAILDEFKNTNKIIEKSKMLILKNGLPKFYVKILMDLEDFLSETLKDKEGIKKMKKEIGKSLNTMKLTLRKHNKDYEAEIIACRANPADYVEVSSDESESSSDDSDSDSDEDSDSDSDAKPATKKKPATAATPSTSKSAPPKASPVKAAAAAAPKVVKKKADSSSDESGSESGSEEDESGEEGSDDEDDEEEDDDEAESGDESEDSWPSESDDSSGEDSSEEEEGKSELKGRAKWLKKVDNTTTTDKRKAKQDAKKAKQSSANTFSEEKYSVKVKQQAPSWKLDENMTEEILEKKVTELVATRGRKGTDPKTVLYQLEVLSKAARYFGPRKEIPVLMHLISAMFDVNRTLDDYLDLRTWRTCRQCLMRIVTILEQNKNLVLGLISAEDLTDLVMSGKQQTDFLKKDATTEDSKTSNPNELKLAGSLENYLTRLEEEYTKSLQQINPHTQDYIVRLSDEALLLELAERVQNYYLRVNDMKAASHIALLRVEHIYYKHDTMSLEVRKAFLFNQKWGKYSELHPACIGKSNASSKDPMICHPAAFKGTPSVPTPKNYHPSQEMETLCNFIFKTGDERAKTRALLCGVYYHAMHDQYHRARDLFLISHIQDNIEKADTSTQILYNRALVTLGLAAFRQGLIQKAYECLFGVCSGRVRELLAQGTGKWLDKDVDQENAERRRQIPYHMHINPDLLEACHLICAMMIELPHLVGRPYDRTIHHRFHFRKYLQSYNRQVFTGPPENTREHVLAAAKALLSGDWRKACRYVLSLEVWNLIPGVDASQKVKAMLNIKLKEEALRIYLYSSAGSAYSSLSLNYICSFFDMDPITTRKIISKMIFRGEISAAWDQTPDGEAIMVLYKVDPSPMQVIALQYAEKLTNLIESNERLLDPLNGSYGYKEEYQRKQHAGSSSTQDQTQNSGAGRGGKPRGPSNRRDNRENRDNRDHRGGHSSNSNNRSNNRGNRGAGNSSTGVTGAGGGSSWNSNSQSNRTGGKSQYGGAGGGGGGGGGGGVGGSGNSKKNVSWNS